MGEKRMEYNYIDILFLNMGKIACNIKQVGIDSFVLEEARLDYNSNDIVYKYLDKGIKLVKSGYITEKLKGELSFELSKICGNSKIDDTRFKALHIIKSLIDPIINGDYDLILEFSKYYCAKSVYAILSDDFKKSSYVV